MFSGAFLGIAAQALLAWGLLFHLMPWIGFDLLWLCQKLADLDLPGKFFRLAGIIDLARAIEKFDIPARAGSLFASFF